MVNRHEPSILPYDRCVLSALRPPQTQHFLVRQVCALSPWGSPKTNKNQRENTFSKHVLLSVSGLHFGIHFDPQSDNFHGLGCFSETDATLCNGMLVWTPGTPSKPSFSPHKIRDDFLHRFPLKITPKCPPNRIPKNTPKRPKSSLGDLTSMEK